VPLAHLNLPTTLLQNGGQTTADREPSQHVERASVYQQVIHRFEEVRALEWTVVKLVVESAKATDKASAETARYAAADPDVNLGSHTVW
jgi:hypothetical protein